MAFLFHSSAPSYASEKLSFHLSSLSTLPITTAPSELSASSALPVSAVSKPSQKLESALQELSSTNHVSREKLVEVLQTLSDSHNDLTTAEKSQLDEEVEVEILSRSIAIIWKEVLQTFLDSALKLDEERGWWEASLNSRRGVGLYLLQTMPHRIYAALPPRSKLSAPEFRSFKLPPRELLFKPLRTRTSAAITSITSPYNLTRREMLSSKNELSQKRDELATKIGILASQGPGWSSKSLSTAQTGVSELREETSRIMAVLCDILEAPALSTKSAAISIQSTPSILLNVLQEQLPKEGESIDKVLAIHSRPSPLTRLWLPALFLPPTLYIVASAIVRNKEYMKVQVRNARETVKGFFVQWVWEPLEGIGKTLRGGGEGLGVAPTTVKSDQESLERMVLDLGRDYYHLSGPELDALSVKIRSGDMEEVLRVYEKELQSPVKNALMGSLVRTLLIQVQKTKTDLSLSLLSLDHLLRSQQLTFAFVGLAPSLLVLYGLGGWLRGVWRGEKRGKARKKQYFNGLRSIERLLITSPKDVQEMSDRDRGLVIISVSSLRTWATGLSGSSRESFMDDLRMIEDPRLRTGDKLRVVERIWRCWGVEGKRKV
ncbi:uncharacterized protein I303_102126 [Kwoniella dejecticola CBS 10117]|uniref:Nuclear control of ATPase protein 2 n=1 Tax=Kwoniella dejecticola CBS 10117 TaxID=1296121 RepID=A0A1A6ABU6_9TREE|nr:uncharacterized protein I303_01733 [Kwoniella dejecticola CBS 10117]OBR87525.1 hypothetical protein I303_01733 [Kwoniella dejecticola CBS 10117]